MSNYAEFQSLLKGEVMSTTVTDDVMISGEVSTQPPPPPPHSCLITAQLEATSLTNAQYSSIASLIHSLLCLPSGALVYAGHTLNPLTVHWHCSAAESNNPMHSLGLLTQMAEEGIKMINVVNKVECAIPQKNVSMCLYNFLTSQLKLCFLVVVVLFVFSLEFRK